MIALSLSEIAGAVNGALHLDGALNADGSPTTPATVVSGAVDTDSREIRPGGIFVAKPGETTDGHLFAPAAIDNGAALLIVERALDHPLA
ncbi:Mur ligase domain-containing protein, partial [Cryobacterium sp. 10I1]|uniref:Mur ligase domain-containing protein n=1 Tax=Cryobacterium sp. 10I1 TaxID=3048578 RepID=UPI002B22A7ED